MRGKIISFLNVNFILSSNACIIMQASLRDKIFELSGAQEQLQSSNAVLESNIQRLKSEKKQLKAYALQQKEQAQSAENTVAQWEAKRAVLENLLAEISPLREELTSHIKNLEKIKHKYVFSSSDGSALDEVLVEQTDNSLFAATNSVGSAEMLSEFAELKGFTPKLSDGNPLPSIAILVDDTKVDNNTVEGEAGVAARERAESEDLLTAMKNKMKIFGEEVEETLDKLMK